MAMNYGRKNAQKAQIWNAFYAANSEESCKSNKIFAAKERKHLRDKDLCCFFFAISAEPNEPQKKKRPLPADHADARR
jgi:hypothetical protein